VVVCRPTTVRQRAHSSSMTGLPEVDRAFSRTGPQVLQVGQ